MAGSSTPISSTAGDSRNVLRISKFIDSEYQVSESIRALEALGLSGHKILIEGLKTGTANVRTKLIDAFYTQPSASATGDGEVALRTPLVRLLVVANIVLVPSEPIRLLVGSSIAYSVSLIKQAFTEQIALPSSQYYFELRDPSVARLVDARTVRAAALGTTELVLVDRNMNEEESRRLSLLVPPPTALLHVVRAHHLSFYLLQQQQHSTPAAAPNEPRWIMQVGRSYEIGVRIHTASGELVHIGDEGVHFETRIGTAETEEGDNSASGVLRSLSVSRNGSYLHVQAVRKGVSQVSAWLEDADGRQVRASQDFELLDPLVIEPSVIVFARGGPTVALYGGIQPSTNRFKKSSDHIFQFV